MRTLDLTPTTLGLTILAALGQAPDGLRLSPIAAIVAAPLTSVDAAVQRLLAAGLAERNDDRRYAITEDAQAGLLLRYGYGTIGGARAGLRANGLVLFAGRDAQGWLLAIRSRRADPAYAHLLELVDGLGEPVEMIEVDGMTPFQAMACRTRASRTEVVAGSVVRAFPRPPREGRGAGQPLHQLNGSLHAPSGRKMRGVAREFGLRRVTAFGSAVRSDFDDESDVDLLVEPRSGRSLGITALASLEDRFEDMFGRRVEVVTPSGLIPDVASALEREGVVLLG